MAIGLTWAAPAFAAPGPIITPYAGAAEAPGTEIPGPATSSPLDFAVGSAVDADGDLYIADVFGEQIAEVDPSGTLSTIAGTGTGGVPGYGGPAASSDMAWPAGLNTWYVISSHTAAWVLKAQHGIIREIGVTDPALTTTSAARRLLVRHL